MTVDRIVTPHLLAEFLDDCNPEKGYASGTAQEARHETGPGTGEGASIFGMPASKAYGKPIQNTDYYSLHRTSIWLFDRSSSCRAVSESTYIIGRKRVSWSQFPMPQN